MMKFMFILMVLMALVMAWWLVPVAFVIWAIVKHWDSIMNADWGKIGDTKDENVINL